MGWPLSFIFRRGPQCGNVPLWHRWILSAKLGVSTRARANRRLLIDRAFIEAVGSEDLV